MIMLILYMNFTSELGLKVRVGWTFFALLFIVYFKNQKNKTVSIFCSLFSFVAATVIIL